MNFREYDPAAGVDGVRPCVVLRLGSPAQLATLRAELAGQQTVAAVELEEGDPACIWVVGEAGCDSNDFFRAVARAADRCNRESAGAAVELVETRLVAAAPEALSGPFPLSRRLWLAPPGQETVPLPAGAQLVLLAAGHVFGSGQHPSTRLAAQALDDLFAAAVPARVLDVGCGSGVLGLACARLGASAVVGIDISADARRIARQNIEINKLQERVRVDERPLDQLDERFDLIVANMTASVLLNLLALLPARLSAAGQMVLAGFHGRQAMALRELLAGHGLVLKKEYEEGNWRGLWLARG